MTQDVVRICRLENGWEVECYEPRPEPKKGTPYHYQEPWKSYGFADVNKALAFLKDKLPALTRKSPEEEYASGFKDAVST